MRRSSGFTRISPTKGCRTQQEFLTSRLPKRTMPDQRQQNERNYLMPTTSNDRNRNQYKSSTQPHTEEIGSAQNESHQRVTLTAFQESGEGEIRTPGTLRHAGFQDRCNRPLCHLSIDFADADFLHTLTAICHLDKRQVKATNRCPWILAHVCEC